VTGTILECVLGLVVGILCLGNLTIRKGKGILTNMDVKLILVMFSLSIVVLIGVLLYWLVVRWEV
jgi:hypothetical protein